MSSGDIQYSAVNGVWRILTAMLLMVAGNVFNDVLVLSINPVEVFLQ